MQIAPSYDRTLVTIEGPPAIGPAMVRQRCRLLDVLGSLREDEWAAPSRCDGWRVQDVAAHLVGVDAFWAASMMAGLSGTPTQLLDGFDPKATPAAMVAAVHDRSPAQTLAELTDATTALCDLVQGFDDDAWSSVAESPAGHVALVEVAHHALWDAWTHERDILLPLGRAQVEEPDEVLASLRYVAAVSPAFALQRRRAERATIVFEASEPDARVVVEVDGAVRVHDGDAPADAIVVRGGAVALVEMLTMRIPMAIDLPAGMRWLVDELASVFEVEVG